MGSTVTIYNNTRFILNLALSQVGPLYYENEVFPGQSMRREVGKVWFTVDGRLWDHGANDYGDSEVVLPIVYVTIAALTVAMGAFGGLVSGSAVLTQLTAGVGVIGATIGASEKTQEIIRNMITGGAIHSLGWYMGSDKNICISGGPLGGYEFINGTYFQAVDANTAHWPFKVAEC